MKKRFILICIISLTISCKCFSQSRTRYLAYEWITDLLKEANPNYKYQPSAFHVVMTPETIEVYMTSPIVLKKVKSYPSFKDEKGRKTLIWDTVDDFGRKSKTTLKFYKNKVHIATLVIDFFDTVYGFKLKKDYIKL